MWPDQFGVDGFDEGFNSSVIVIINRLVLVAKTRNYWLMVLEAYVQLFDETSLKNSNIPPSDEPDNVKLSPESRTREQINSVQDIYKILMPDTRIAFLFLSSDRPEGARDDTTFQPYKETGFFAKLPEPTDDALFDEAQKEFGGVILGAAIQGGADSKTPDLLVRVAIPREVKVAETSEDTSLKFQRRYLNSIAMAVPLWFEEAKNVYETKQRADLKKNHRHTPVDRDWNNFYRGPERRDQTKRPAILIGFHWLETGGAENLAFDCVNWALDVGLRVIVMVERASPHFAIDKLPDHPDVSFVPVDAYLPRDKVTDFIIRLISHENVRAMHIHHNTDMYASLQKVKFEYPGLRVIDSTHIIEHRNGGFPRISGVWTNFIDHHHVISNELVEYYINEFSVCERVVLGRMLDTAEVNKPVDVIEPRMQAGQKTCRLVYVGRMVHQKRAPLMVAITKRLAKWAKRNNIHLEVDIVGSGAYLSSVKSMLRRARLNEIVTTHAPGADVPKLMRKADILVVPSSNEGLALVCYEAIENGAIPIATKVGAQAELVPPELLVRKRPSHCVKDTTALIKRMLTDETFLDACKIGIEKRYLEVRKDETAEKVVKHIYEETLRNT